MNLVILTGRLVKDPELRKASDTTFVTFTVASQRNFKNKDGQYDSDFIECNASGTLAEHIAKYYHKGNGIEIEGEWRHEAYTNKEGKKVYTDRCRVNSAHFPVGNPKDSGEAPKEEKPKVETKNTEEVKDDDLPF